MRLFEVLTVWGQPPRSKCGCPLLFVSSGSEYTAPPAPTTGSRSWISLRPNAYIIPYNRMLYHKFVSNVSDDNKETQHVPQMRSPFWFRGKRNRGRPSTSQSPRQFLQTLFVKICLLPDKLYKRVAGSGSGNLLHFIPVAVGNGPEGIAVVLGP